MTARRRGGRRPNAPVHGDSCPSWSAPRAVFRITGTCAASSERRLALAMSSARLWPTDPAMTIRMSQKNDNHAAPVAVDDELHLTVAGGRVQLTPRSALALAEDL